MGKFNSSATRVAPVFQTLIDRDKSGKTWLPSLLNLFPNHRAFTPELLAEPGEITTSQFGKNELCLNPPLRFLRWMVGNPHKLNWPRHEIRNKHILDMRERLMLRGLYEGATEVRKQAIESARAEMELAIGAPAIGGGGWLRRWWVLEGRTHVDCYIETTRLRLFVEGKRTEKLSPSTSWYSKRNQLLRNLEAASVHSSGHPFAQLLITEEPAADLPAQIVLDSLPHLSVEERSELLRHYAGAVTWQSLCSAVGLRYETLPHTVPD
ncbi:MAG: hypothetical protein WAM87_18540 [Terriglobales bacterium]